MQVEYRALTNDLADSASGITYIGGAVPSGPARSSRSPPSGKASRVGRGAHGALELQAWVPVAVADAALDLRQRLAGFEVAYGDLRDFLRTANRSWRQREKTKLRAQKKRYIKEITSLRRQISQRCVHLTGRATSAHVHASFFCQAYRFAINGLSQAQVRERAHTRLYRRPLVYVVAGSECGFRISQAATSKRCPSRGRRLRGRGSSYQLGQDAWRRIGA